GKAGNCVMRGAHQMDSTLRYRWGHRDFARSFTFRVLSKSTGSSSQIVPRRAGGERRIAKKFPNDGLHLSKGTFKALCDRRGWRAQVKVVRLKRSTNVRGKQFRPGLPPGSQCEPIVVDRLRDR